MAPASEWESWEPGVGEEDEPVSNPTPTPDLQALLENPNLPRHIGEPEEANVRAYLQHPTQAGRDYCMSLCDRFIKFFYKQYRVGMEWGDFYDEAVLRCLELLDRFDPAKGSFVGWVMVGLDGFAKSKRDHHTRYHTTNCFCGLSLREEVEKVSVQTSEDLHRGAPRSLLCGLTRGVEVRFQSPKHRTLFRAVLDFLVRRGRYPSEQWIQNVGSKLGISVRAVEFLWQYLQVRVRLTCLKQKEMLEK
jgi:hypothetical protein